MKKEEFNKLYKEWKELEKIIKSTLTSGRSYKLINSRDILRQPKVYNPPFEREKRKTSKIAKFFLVLVIILCSDLWWLVCQIIFW